VCLRIRAQALPDIAGRGAIGNILGLSTLRSLTGTSELSATAKIITRTGAPNEVGTQRAALPERGPALIAIGPDGTLQTVGPSLDA
jgi:hypothetical protein